MNNKAFKEFDVMVELVRTGCDPECADMSNPEGIILGEAAHVRAFNEYGDTKLLFIGIGNAAIRKAESLIPGLTARAASGREPVAFNTWQDGRAMFGSQAYIDYGAADDLAWERSQEGLDPY